MIAFSSLHRCRRKKSSVPSKRRENQGKLSWESGTPPLREGSAEAAFLPCHCFVIQVQAWQSLPCPACACLFGSLPAWWSPVLLGVSGARHATEGVFHGT